MGSHDSLNQAEGAPRFWYRDNFFLTNDKTYLCPKTFNKSLDDNWWSSPLPNGQLQRVLDNCLTLAVYYTPQTAEEMKSKLIESIESLLSPVLTLTQRTVSLNQKMAPRTRWSASLVW